jgi:hypothetical protein
LNRILILALAMALPRTAGARTSMLVLPVDARSAALKEGADSITTLIAGELRQRKNLSVVTFQEVEGTLSIDQRRQLAGCDSVSCAADIAGALNTDEILMSSLGQVGQHNLVLSMSRIKANRATVVGASVRRVQSDEVGRILDEIPGMVCEVLDDCGGVALAPRSKPVAREAEQPARVANPAYDEKYLEIRERIRVSSNKNGTTMTPELFPVRGKYAKEIDWDEFYETVGRPDLAAGYQEARIRRWVLFGVGFAIMAVGWLPYLAGIVAGLTVVVVGVVIVALLLSAMPVLFLIPVGLGLGAAALGGVGTLTSYGVATGLVVGGFVAPLHGVEPDEWRRMADGYNSQLRSGATSSGDGD